jgi:hypothetical protein
MIKFSIKQEQMAAAFNYLNVRDAHKGNPLLLKRASFLFPGVRRSKIARTIKGQTASIVLLRLLFIF